MKKYFELLLLSILFVPVAVRANVITIASPEDFPTGWKLNPGPTKGIAEYKIVEETGEAFKGTRCAYLQGHLMFSNRISVTEGDEIEVRFYSRGAEGETVSAMLYTYRLDPGDHRMKWTGALAGVPRQVTPEWSENSVAVKIPAKNENQPVDSVIVALTSRTGAYFDYVEIFHLLKGGQWQKHMEEGKKVYEWDRQAAPSRFMRPAIDFKEAQKYFRLALGSAKKDGEKAEALLSLGESLLYDQDETGYEAVRPLFEKVLAFPDIPPEVKAQAYLGIGETCLREKKYPEARKAFEHARNKGLPLQAQLAEAFSFLQEKDYPAALQKLGSLAKEENLDMTTAALVESYTAAIRQVPMITKSRPRLFFNEETWPSVKARALGEEKEYFEGMKKEVESIEPWEIRTGDFGIQLMKAAFVYRITEDEALLDMVRKMLRSTLDFYLARSNNDHTRSYSRVGTVAALDWVWDDLAPDERESFASDLLRYAYTIYIEDRIQNRIDSHFVYYVQDMLWYAGAALIDGGLDDVTHARVLTLLGQGYCQKKRMFAQMEEIAGDDGAWQAKLDYAFAHQPTVFWAFMHCIRSCMAKEASDSWINIVNPDYVLRNFLGISNRAMLHFGYDRSWGTKTAHAGFLHDHLRQFIHFFGKSHPRYASIAGLLKERIEAEAGQGYGAHPVNPFLYTGIEKAPPPGIPENMPVARHFENLGLVFMSSGFNPEKDTYALFSCGGGVNNALHYDTTHFSIYKKGYLALDSGSGNPEHSPHTVNYALQTVAHNALLIHMDGENNHGGQDRRTKFAKVVAFETSPLFSYIATDATETYNPEKCRQMVRQFIYLNPDHFVIFDRAVSIKPEYSKEWLLHTSNEPQVSGTGFKAEQGQGRIFCRTLYPPDAVLEKTGGPGKEFLSGGKNWPIEGTFAREKMKGPGDVTDTLGRWRVEVKPGSSREEDVFLHLVQVSGQDVEAMEESRLSEKNGRLTVKFSHGNRQYEISINKTGDIGGHIKIIETGKTVVDRTLTREVMPQSGLALQE